MINYLQSDSWISQGLPAAISRHNCNLSKQHGANDCRPTDFPRLFPSVRVRRPTAYLQCTLLYYRHNVNIFKIPLGPQLGIGKVVCRRRLLCLKYRFLNPKTASYLNHHLLRKSYLRRSLLKLEESDLKSTRFPIYLVARSLAELYY